MSSFDYSALPIELGEAMRATAVRVRELPLRRFTGKDAVALGKELLAYKSSMPLARFYAWLHAETFLTRPYATGFIDIYERFGIPSVAIDAGECQALLRLTAVTTLRALAAASIPFEVVSLALKKAASGSKVSGDDVKAWRAAVALPIANPTSADTLSLDAAKPLSTPFDPIKAKDEFRKFLGHFEVWVDHKPLAIGVHKEIRAALQAAGLWTSKAVWDKHLTGVLYWHCANSRYLANTAKGGYRYHLDGAIAAEISPEEAAFSQGKLPPPPPPKPNPRKPVVVKKARTQQPLVLPLDEVIPVPGKIEITVKFGELPKPSITQQSVSFKVIDGKTTIIATVKPKVWKKLTDAAAKFPTWIAALTGKPGVLTADSIQLLEATIQVFEKKPKNPATS